MGIALRAARENAAAGETPVGALVVSPGGEILGLGANRVIRDRDPSAHAEIIAIREACRGLDNDRLNECVLVVTLEPCLMCAAAIRRARATGVVFGCLDALEGAIVSRSDYIALTGDKNCIWHLGGVLADQCAAALTGFFKGLRHNGADSK